MKRFAFIVMIAIAIILQTNPALAWQTRHTLKVLVESSLLIITGKVSDVSSKIEKEGKREVIYTYVTVEIQSILNGKTEKPNVTIKMLGGRVGNRGGWSEELFTFNKDEEVLLFLHLEDKSKNIWKIKSISGKLSVANVNGIKCFDCSMLRADEVSQYGPHAQFEQNEIINRIKNYLLTKGGK